MSHEFTPYDFHGTPSAEDFKAFMAWCATQQVSDINMQGGSPLSVARFGRRCRASHMVLACDTVSRLTDEVFGLDIRPVITSGQPVDRAFQLDGDMNGRYGLQRGERVRFRCNFILGTAGRFEESISLTMRVIPSAIPSLDSLNIEPELKAALLPQQGLGLVCGATASGKSTLLAAIYRYCQDNFPDRVIVTYEDPVEYILGRDTDLLKPHQSQIGRHVPGFAEGIRAGMRRNPDLIGVGEIRDQETAEAAIAAGESGHVCLATCHTHSPGETISRMLGLLPVQSRDAMAHALLGTLSFIVVQVLVRTRDGRRRAVREFITFDTALRSALGQLPHEKWGEHIDNIILLEKRRIADQVATLYRRHDITREEACLFIPHHEWSRLPDA